MITHSFFNWYFDANENLFPGNEGQKVKLKKALNINHVIANPYAPSTNQGAASQKLSYYFA